MSSRPRIGWTDLAGAPVGIWGLGVEGAANLRKLLAIGATPVIVDDHPSATTAHGLAVRSTAAGGWEALSHCEVVVKTPGISRYRPDVTALEDHGVAVVGGLGLWLEEADRSRVVCITGTKGKSTTTTIVGHLLRGLGRSCLVGGNIGRLPYDPEIEGTTEFTAVEVSSFQATDLGCAPPVVAVTSLHPDHLDWHGSVARYYADKLSICTRPGAALTIANGDSDELRAEETQLGPRVQWIEDQEAPWSDPLGLLGSHNRRNALIARACMVALGVDEDDRALERAARGFEVLDSRLHEIGVVRGVTFVDDSLSTNALAAIAALDAFEDRPVALVVGGADRGIDYAPLADRVVTRRAPTLIITLPANGARIRAAIDEAAAHAGTAPSNAHDTGDLDSAIDKAMEWAEPGSVVLLSPAAASFGQFANYKERADAFRRAMDRYREADALSPRRARSD
jgi:UDP-N-acetylmuramoyl-L-alanine---L-glutamate ligase